MTQDQIVNPAYKLIEIERQLPELLLDEATWHGVFVNYHPPFVERLWRQLGNWRINLHRIFPCHPGEALFHPHPWPSAMHVLEGFYEMKIGYGEGKDEPSVAATIVLGAQSRYEMNEPHAWHSVRPIVAPVLTVMVSGPPWKRESPKSKEKLPHLDHEKRQRLFASFAPFFYKIR